MDECEMSVFGLLDQGQVMPAFFSKRAKLPEENGIAAEYLTPPLAIFVPQGLLQENPTPCAAN